MIASTPAFHEFDPTHIDYQRRVLNDLNYNFDYSLGVHELLLSGSVGSAKSLLGAHCGLTHVFTFPRARLLLGREAMPDLRDTIYTKFLEHLEGTVKDDGTTIREGVDFGSSDYKCEIWFKNGSEIISRSWHDKRYKRLGSLECSAAIIEEASENEGDHWTAIKYIRTRIGRLPHITRNWIMYLTNPDAPGHPLYDYFQLAERQAGIKVGLKPTRHVYFSNTFDNPFLPSWYINQLKEDLDENMVKRLVYGQWVEIDKDTVYYAYNTENNYKETEYEVKLDLPIHISFDFNIGEGKPMSCCLSQFDGSFHFFAEKVVHGADTEELMQELGGSGLLDYDTNYIINGDATGGSRDTRSKTTDYDIIIKFLSNYRTKDHRKLEVSKHVPASNPPIRKRHNLVNGYCRNANNKVRLFVYKTCPTLHKGFRLTTLKPGGNYIEDDSKAWQHVTTAAGYNIVWVHNRQNQQSGVRYIPR